MSIQTLGNVLKEMEKKMNVDKETKFHCKHIKLEKLTDTISIEIGLHMNL